MSKTPVSWTAYSVAYRPNCDPDEIIGYFQTQASAMEAAMNFRKERNLKEKGICCSNALNVEVREITIEP